MLIPIESHQTTPQDPTDFIGRFLEGRDLSASSARSYRAKLEAFFLWASENEYAPITTESLILYVKHLKAKGFTSSSSASYITPVKLFYRWMSNRYGVTDIAADDRVSVKSRSKKHLKGALTAEQAKRVLAVSVQESTRDHALLMLLFNTGLRSVEVVRAKVGDLRGEVLHVQGKGRTEKDDFVILNPHTKEALHNYLQSRDRLTAESPLFVSESNRSQGQALTGRSIQHIVNTYFTKAGVKEALITPHSTRHTFATIALSNGADVMQVKEALRHSSVQTTMRYTHMLDRVENAAERLVGLHV